MYIKSTQHNVWEIITHGDKVDAIQITYESTKDVQDRKVATLMRHYKMFIMKEDETIDDISLGYEFSKAHNNLKILNSLPKTRETSLKKKEKHLKSFKFETYDSSNDSSNEIIDDEISLIYDKEVQTDAKKERSLVTSKLIVQSSKRSSIQRKRRV
ncbi:hypothetical protein CR513_42225, partial [Mucuna pruriens]